MICNLRRVIYGYISEGLKNSLKGDDDMDDSAIVDLFLARDESAITAASKKYGRKLRAVACNILDDEAAAEECENDTYLRAWDSIPPHEPRDYLFPFLGRIIRHIAIDECRKRSSLKRPAAVCELTMELEECIPDRNNTEEETDAAELGRIIDRFLDEYPEEKRRVFVRRYWFCDPVSAISERYGISQSKIKTMLFRIRKDLREYLEKEGYTI